MSDNNRSVNSEQLRNLRLRQPHTVVLHADVQTGLAVGCLINDNLAPVHESKDTNKPEKSITFRPQPIRPSLSRKRRRTLEISTSERLPQSPKQSEKK